MLRDSTPPRGGRLLARVITAMMMATLGMVTVRAMMTMMAAVMLMMLMMLIRPADTSLAYRTSSAPSHHLSR